MRVFSKTNDRGKVREAREAALDRRHTQKKKLGERGKKTESRLLLRLSLSLSYAFLLSAPFCLEGENNAMLRLALAASKRGAASAVAESVLPSSSSAAAASSFTRSFAALPATTSEASSPFLRFASPAPAAHDFTPALQGLPETKVKYEDEGRAGEEEKKRARRPSSKRRIAIAFFPLLLLLLSLSLSFHGRARAPHLARCLSTLASPELPLEEKGANERAQRL